MREPREGNRTESCSALSRPIIATGSALPSHTHLGTYNMTINDYRRKQKQASGLSLSATWHAPMHRERDGRFSLQLLLSAQSTDLFTAVGGTRYRLQSRSHSFFWWIPLNFDETPGSSSTTYKAKPGRADFPFGLLDWCPMPIFNLALAG